jgi:heavy metal efflux system protein
VTPVVSQTGRPDDGTDTGGFGNTEYFVDLKPNDQWRPVFHKDKDELIAAMNREVEKYPLGFSGTSRSPLKTTSDETMTGTKGGWRPSFMGTT